MPTFDVLRTGAAIGLTVAVPLGPIGLMVVTLGRRDFRSGAAAAAGVAAADLTWAAVAVSGGAAIATLPAITMWRGGAHAVLVAVGVLLVARGVRDLRTRCAGHPTTAGGAPGLTDGRAGRVPTSEDERVGPMPIPDGRSAVRWFVALYGLTLPNPLTVAVFTAAAVGLGVGDDPVARAWFVLAVGLTSLAWQLLLAAGGRHLLARAGPAVGAVLTALSGVALLTWPLLFA